MIKTGQLVPDFEFAVHGSDRWRSRIPLSGMARLLVVYRGSWCPHCKAQLQALDKLTDRFIQSEVMPVAVSADAEEPAIQTVRDWGLHRLDLGYAFPLQAARALGVLCSSAQKKPEPPLFYEPATFLIDPENRIAAAWLASNAFARTPIDGVLAYVDFLRNHPDRAPRGAD